MVPYIEGEGAAAFGIVAGVHAVAAGLVAGTGKIICVALVVLIGARARAAVVEYRARRVAAAPAAATWVEVGIAQPLDPLEPPEAPEPKSKGRQRLERWLLRFGVPGASLLAPLALPTMLTAATFVALGVRKNRVIRWQVIAIVIWTGGATVIATRLVDVIAA
jgi:hypothetical protein